MITLQNFPLIIEHIWYWHWERPVRNVEIDCTKHNQKNTFCLEYNGEKWYIGYKYDNKWNTKISISHKSIIIAQKQLKLKLDKALKEKISKDGQFEGNEFKIKII